MGDKDFANALESALGYDAAKWNQQAPAGASAASSLAAAGRIFRFVDHNDIVTRVPPDDIYIHAGPAIYFTADGHLDLSMTEAKRFDQSVLDVITGFKTFAQSSLADHSSEKYLNILQQLATTT